jgi:transposase
MSKTLDERQQFIELRAKGNSYDSIAKQIRVSKPTLISWSNELEMELANYKTMEQDALREEYLATKKHRIVMQGEQLKSIRKELHKRDYSDVPTHKLIELVIKLSDNLANEEEQVTFTGDGLQKIRLKYQWNG